MDPTQMFHALQNGLESIGYKLNSSSEVRVGNTLKRMAISSSGAPAHLRWIADVPKFARIKIELEQFQPFHLEYFASANDVHMKYFYRRQPPACL